jgi:hypothetical protein
MCRCGTRDVKILTRVPASLRRQDRPELPHRSGAAVSRKASRIGRAVKELATDEAIAAADTLLLTVPNTLGVDYNAHAIESILKYVAPELGWR